MKIKIDGDEVVNFEGLGKWIGFAVGMGCLFVLIKLTIIIGILGLIFYGLFALLGWV